MTSPDLEPSPEDLRTSYSQPPHRMLPQSQDAELGLLGSILLSPAEVMGECVQKKITPEYFHVPANGIIFAILRELYDANKPIDFILLTQLLLDRQLLDKVGGPAFVTQLFCFVPTALNSGYYIEIIKEKYMLREVIVTCNTFGAKAYEMDGEDPDGFLDELEGKINAIGQARFAATRFDLKNETFEAINALEQLYERKGAISGLSTGFDDVDVILDGLHETEMIVIAARPSMGKTAFAMNIAEHVAVDHKNPVAIFSLEMSTRQLIQRMICCRSKVNQKDLAKGYLSEGDFQRMTKATAEIAEAPLIIDDTAGLSILELRARARKMKREDGIKLIVIDYLQLLKSDSKRGKDNRQIEIAEISQGVKGLAKELGIPIIVLAQLNRNPEGRGGGIPRLSDLRESGSIEQDADVVGMLHREEYYAEGEEAKEEASGKASFNIVKQRNGPLENILLTFLKQFTRFESRAKEPNE